MNLLKETIDAIKKNHQYVENIIHIGNYEYGMTWDEFKKLADVDYNPNTKKFRVAMDLIIIFKDFDWLERVHDSFYERWQYHDLPHIAPKTKKIKNIFGEDSDLKQCQLVAQKPRK